MVRHSLNVNKLSMEKEEVILLENLFESYQKKINSFDGVFNEINKKYWSKTPAITISPFSIERNGFKKGNIIKKEPTNKDGIFEYGFDNEKLILTSFYNKWGASSLKFYIYYKDRIESFQFVNGYDDEPKTLVRVEIYYMNSNFSISKMISYYKAYFDDDNLNSFSSEIDFQKEIYFYEKEMICKIEVRGQIERYKMKNEKNIIFRNTDYMIVYNSNNELDKIFGVQLDKNIESIVYKS